MGTQDQIIKWVYNYNNAQDILSIRCRVSYDALNTEQVTIYPNITPTLDEGVNGNYINRALFNATTTGTVNGELDCIGDTLTYKENGVVLASYTMNTGNTATGVAFYSSGDGDTSISNIQVCDASGCDGSPAPTATPVPTATPSPTPTPTNGWQKYSENPIYTGGSTWGTNVAVTPIVLKVNNIYQMWYIGNNGQGWRIGYASSPDGISNWTTLPNDVVPVGTPDGWEKEVIDPSIIYDNGVYKMWYVSSNTDHWTSGSDRFRIRYATSNDGINWTLTPGWVMYGTSGSWDEGGINRGMTVLKIGGTYHMWYAGTNTNDLAVNPYWRIGYATSPDGINWTKQNNGNPVIEPTQPWEGNNVSGPNVIYENGIYKMWYEKRNGDAPTNELIYATSIDGINWNKPADMNPALTSSHSGFDSQSVLTPYVMHDGSIYKLWYGGNDGQNTSIGYAYLSSSTNQPPSISPLTNKTVNEGTVYSESGSFTDPDSSSWSATVDYGDGSGIQPLTLSGQSFTLSHTYKDEGSYTATVAIEDNQEASSSAETSVTVINEPPTVGSITASASLIEVNTTITASAHFTDPGVLDSHTATWNWGNIISEGTITESNGTGSVLDSHTYTQAGVYTPTLTVTDEDGLAVMSSPFQYIVVYDPSAGFITGAGTIDSNAGADMLNISTTGKAMFGINVKYINGQSVPTGSTKFNFPAGDISLSSTSYDWLVISGNKAYFHGSGTVNNTGSYSFLITMIDGNPDTLRIKIKDNTNGNIIYDNQMNSSDFADPSVAISTGQIKVH
jgi:hypothetical protein